MNKSTLVLILHSGLGGLFGGVLSTLRTESNTVPLMVIWFLYIVAGITGTIYGAMAEEES